MGLPPSLGPVPAVYWARLQACSWSSCPGQAPCVDEAFCLLSLPSQATCGLLWVAQLPGCVLAGPGLSCLPSAWPASGTGPRGRVRGLSPTQIYEGLSWALSAVCSLLLILSQTNDVKEVITGVLMPKGKSRQASQGHLINKSRLKWTLSKPRLHSFIFDYSSSHITGKSYTLAFVQYSVAL